ncbi:MAG: phosphate-binding protein [Acidimicrobiia bacterium]|nr:substrate-binding domain-containing protein [Acidimicrobiia bacterium]NNF70172.1 phosphate-binding protein [Acidimicrobiia bacterium]
MSREFWRLGAVALAIALVATACGGDESGDSTAATTTSGSTTTTQPAASGVDSWGYDLVDPLDVGSGDIGIAGSSTVFPLSVAVIAQWQDEGGPQYSIDSIGSGGGFERFCVEGASDISNASRAIKESEVESCGGIGRTPIEIRVGSDALTAVVSKGNTFASSLTLEQLATAFSLPAGSTWADVDPAFPPHPLASYSPGADSGTFDYFNEVVFDEAEPSPILSSGANIVGEDDNITVRGVADDGCAEGDTTTTCAIGFFGFAFFQANAGDLTAVAVGGVAPGADTVNDGSYPISRPLFMYTDAGIVADKPQVGEFILYYLQNVNSLIGEVGYFPAPDAQLQGAADAIAAALGL